MRLMLTLLGVLLLAACYPQADTPAPDGNDLEACPDTIDISGFAFQPASCTVEAGTTLTFVNQDSAPHTATSRPGSPADFDTGTLNQSESASVTLDAAGEYRYFCQIHPDMEGTIVVTDGDNGDSGDSGDSGSSGSSSGY